MDIDKLSLTRPSRPRNLRALVDQFFQLAIAMRTAFALLLCLTFLPVDNVIRAQAPDAPADNPDGGEPLPPTLDSPLLRQPESLRDMFDAARLMTDLARYRLAKRYLEMLLEKNPDGAELLKLRDRFGPAELLRLSRVQELRPASSDLLKKVNEAFGAASKDTQRIDRLVAKLAATPREREVALVTLRDSGATAIPRLLVSLGDPKNSEDHKLLVYALAKLGPEVVPSLLAAMDSPNPELRISVAEALGWIGSRDAIPHLLYPAYSSAENEKVRLKSLEAIKRIAKNESIVQGSLGAAAALRRQALAHLSGKLEPEAGPDGTVDAWVWDEGAGTIAAVPVTPTAASLFAGTRFAANAARLSPENAESQAVFLALSLGREAHSAGWSKPVATGPGTAHDLALSSGEKASVRALQIALENHNADAARGALQVLGELGSPANADNSSLHAALNYPNARIQFAAANAIMNRGNVDASQRLLEVFSRVLNGAGQAHGVVIEPNTTRSQLLVSQLDGFGYKALIAQTGREGFRLAAESANVAIVVVNANCADWALSETIVNLRADQRTASAPIVILGAATSQTKLEAMAARHQAMTFLDESLVADSLARTLRQFIERYNPALSQRERSEQRGLAAYWLAHLAETNAPARTALSAAEPGLANAVDDPRLMSDALSALSRIPTTSAQGRLLQIILTATRPPESRELAAVQLAAHMQRHGVLLESGQRDELLKVSEGEIPPALATALATIHGVMRPDRTTIQKQVESFGLPPRP